MGNADFPVVLNAQPDESCLDQTQKTPQSILGRLLFSRCQHLFVFCYRAELRFCCLCLLSDFEAQG